MPGPLLRWRKTPVPRNPPYYNRSEQGSIDMRLMRDNRSRELYGDDAWTDLAGRSESHHRRSVPIGCASPLGAVALLSGHGYNRGACALDFKGYCGKLSLE